ncbi:class II histone deacetylase [Phaeovulum veldkampii]|uniref:Class II histone deacetylase n=1 Tax=Phaeovulum veldkampii DSM 11550 TaxID=1185920 RepID=A0A2T4JGJ1_9RHOB|nr:class II histone deacetylase [Phaeovulum veldkampii]PTE16963.1 class II histone deacetylase [Phaeovulum veldkampii DSM 11550]TDQ55992.1 acetoin utilization deacetylase AcuC-like enzyme [Phaeovulum veldkampii DSM 11550]
MTTAFFHDERCLWHGGGNYAFTLPVGGLVQPGAGLPESPETKRRLVNLMRVTGLMSDLVEQSAPPASHQDLRRVHPESYLSAFKAASDAGGGELGLRTPFGQGGYDIAALSAGLARGALFAVLGGQARNAYALTRPPGHHCLPEFPNGFCLLNNIAVAIRAAQAAGLARRIAVVDWDVHHGNGTEAIFLSDPEVLTISLHQDRNYPLDTGAADQRGAGRGHGFNLNIPLPPGTGHASYIEAFDRLVLPALYRFGPEIIVVACGYDASAVDPLGRMLASSDTFGALTRRVMQAADDLCDGRLMLAHEGGYSEVHVPFCGHAVIATLAGSHIKAPDPLAATLAARQPGPDWQAHVSAHIGRLAEFFF